VERPQTSILFRHCSPIAETAAQGVYAPAMVMVQPKAEHLTELRTLLDNDSHRPCREGAALAEVRQAHEVARAVNTRGQDRAAVGGSKFNHIVIQLCFFRALCVSWLKNIFEPRRRPPSVFLKGSTIDAAYSH
jgi:hypothetical protein